MLDAGVREVTDLLQTLGLVAQFLYVPAVGGVAAEEEAGQVEVCSVSPVSVSSSYPSRTW